MAKTLEYYFVIAKVIVYVIFNKYTIDENGVVRNKATQKALRYTKNKAGYQNVSVRDDSGKQRGIRIARAIVSTFLGPPPTPDHTADHINQIPDNDNLKNLKWATKTEQNNNQTRLGIDKDAYLVVHDGEEKTVMEWVQYFNDKDEKNHMNNKYTKSIIEHYAIRKHHGFAYKTYPDLPGEVWKDVEGSKNKRGMWQVSNMNRFKYITNHAENVLERDRLGLDKGYPTIYFNGKQWMCHVVAFMTFFPEEWTNKKPDEMILHNEDNKLDFRPEMLRLGTRSENTKDSYDNGKYDGTLRERQKCASYKDGAFEKEHESQDAAAEYLRSIGYDKARPGNIGQALRAYDEGKVIIRRGRTWKRLN